MNNIEKEKIIGFDQEIIEPVRLTFLDNDDDAGKEIESFLKFLVSKSEKVTFKKEESESGRSGIRLAENLLYQGVPLGTELGPFLELLKIFSSKNPDLPEGLKDILVKSTLPASFRLYVSTACAFCPTVFQKIANLALFSELISLEVIDGQVYHEQASKEGIRSVPTLILEDEFRWVGQIDINEIGEAILNRDYETLGPSSLENFLKQGNAAKLSVSMIESKKVYPSLITLLLHETWSTRLGAMVVVEDLAECGEVELIQELEQCLWDGFARATGAVRGDLIYLIGLTGKHESSQKLSEMLESDIDDLNEELRETISESIQEIAERL